MFERALNLETGLPCALSTRLRFGLARIWLFWPVTADLYPNEVSGIENGTTHNDIKVRTFSIPPYANILKTADLYPNEESGIENGTMHNDINIRKFSIWP